MIGKSSSQVALGPHVHDINGYAIDAHRYVLLANTRNRNDPPLYVMWHAPCVIWYAPCVIWYTYRSVCLTQNKMYAL